MNHTADRLVKIRGGHVMEKKPIQAEHQFNAKKVLFLDLPFQSFEGGSLGISTLKAILNREGIAVDVHYLSVDFAQIVGVPFYRFMCFREGSQYRGGIFFSPYYYEKPLIPFAKQSLPEYFAGIQPPTPGIPGIDQVWTDEMFLRKCETVFVEEVPRFLEHAAAAIEWTNYDIVCFSLMFDQTLVAACLAKWIKKNHPATKVVFGGANCDDEMGPEMIKAFPCIDVVAVGEADRTIAALVQALRGQGSLDDVPGIVFRRNGEIVRNEPPPVVEDLDWLPIPDYTDYFEAIRQSDIQNPLFLYFEMSRGCWWGQKHLCSFCGLNADGLAFRRKSPERSLQELETLLDRHGCARFAATDNIVDMSFFKTLLPALALRNNECSPESRIQLWCQFKSNLKKPQIQLIRDAGVFGIQPGIESYGDRILELMDKGATGIQQVQFAKWSTETGLKLLYGLLYGIPGETAEDYDEMRALLPYISHLVPPTYLGRISLDRFSPYYKNPERYGIRNIAPHDSYARLYTDEKIDLNRLAYKFTFQHDDHRNERLNQAIRNWHDGVERWMNEFRPETLLYARSEDGVLVLDRRHERPTLTLLRDEQAEIFLFCDEYRSLASIQRTFSYFGEENVLEFIERLRVRRWLYRDAHGRCLSLPLQSDLSKLVQGNRVATLPQASELLERVFY